MLFKSDKNVCPFVNAESSRSIAGAKTAYFPKNQDCLTTKSNNDLEAQLIQQFKRELKDIEGETENDCLLCG